ncbi:MAG TPA: AMP-binding protein [Dehalococcoidia bacterium]|nr:AMP-binding protein [Dehalococcoidia bacterium]
MRLHDLLDYQASVRPQHDFAVYGGRRMSYAEARLESNRLANALLASGLAPGERFAYLSRNSLDYALMYFGASKAGLVPVPLNYRLAPPEWEYIINDAGAKLLIASAEYTSGIDGVRTSLRGVRRFVALAESAPAGWEAYGGWLAGASTEAPQRYVREDEDAYQMYTSGTTGHPKGALLTHRAVTANVMQVLTSSVLVQPGDRYLIVVPLYHAAGVISLLDTVAAGGTSVIHQDFIPAEVVRALSEDNINACTLVPAMIQACLVAVPDVAQREYRSLRSIAYGASPIAESTLRAAMQTFGCGFMQAYGMTELTAVATVLSPDDHVAALNGRPHLLTSAGRAVMGTEIRVVDEEDRPLAPGSIGEIIVRGPQMMRGYWNLPDESGAALRGGWMHTGDAGVMDAEGYVYIQDRVKDMIISGGENVYPRRRAAACCWSGWTALKARVGPRNLRRVAEHKQVEEAYP